ncbi:hypothetical protein Tco_0052213 [Tanacetum coccineum]
MCSVPLTDPHHLQDSPAEEAETESNVWDDGSEDVNPFGGGNPGFHDGQYDNPLLTMKTESKPIFWDIGDKEEEYSFVNKYLKEEAMPVPDTDIEDVQLRRKNDLFRKEESVGKKTTKRDDECGLMIFVLQRSKLL